MKSSIFLLLQPKESYKNSSKGAWRSAFSPWRFPTNVSQSCNANKKKLSVWVKKHNRERTKKTLKFKVYVFRTQAQGLAGIIISRSSVTVNRLSLTSARVTHILYSQIRTHTHISFAFLLPHLLHAYKHHQSHSSKLKSHMYTHASRFLPLENTFALELHTTTKERL